MEPKQESVETVEALTGMEVVRDPGLFLLVYGDGRSRSLDLPEGVDITVGRSRGATLSFPADEQLSRIHAVIQREGDTIKIVDQSSRNGTWLNGTRVEGSAQARAGDSVDVGSSTLLIARRAPRRHAVVEPETVLDDCLASEVFRATRYRRSLALLAVRLSGSPEAVDEGLDRLAGEIRPMDRLIGYGQDEIAVVLPETDLRAAVVAAERVLERLRSTPGLSAIAGVATVPDHGTSAGALLGEARAALRSAGRTQAPQPVVAPTAHDASADPTAPVAVDPRARQTFDLARKVALAPTTVLLLGETGVGKEVVAGIIHQESHRRDRRFVRLDCASLPPTLLESELFGHERGAFTGADKRKLGYFEVAAGGTILLDEIGELPLPLQAKLLAALERRVITRVGSTEEIPVDVRLIAATHRDLQQDVREGRFREDLYYRLAVFTIYVPPLRDRPTDIMPLANAFAERFARELGQAPPSFSDEARIGLESYSWPGNVRELRNAIERAVVLTPEGAILPSSLPDPIHLRARRAVETGARGTAASPQPIELNGKVPAQLEEMERQVIMAALEATGGNQTQAARRLGISRRALIYKMERFGYKAPPRSREG